MDTEITMIPQSEINEQRDKSLSLAVRLRLNLSEEKLKEIAKFCIDWIEQIITERQEFADKVKTWRNQYFGVVRPKNIPSPAAFNVHVPYTKKAIDGAVSQTEEAFEDVDPKWVIPSRNKVEYEERDKEEKVLDYYSDTEMESRSPWEKVYHDAYLLGNGFLGIPYVKRTEKMIQVVKYSSAEQFMADFPDAAEKHAKVLNRLLNGEETYLEVKKEVVVCDAPKPEHYEWEDIVVPINTPLYENDMFVGFNNSPLVAKKVSYSWNEICRLEKKGDFEKGVSEKLKYKNEEDERNNKINPEYLKKDFDCWEVQYFVDIDDDGEQERCLFIFEAEKQLTLQQIRYPYNDGRCYIIPFVISHTKPGIYQEGLGEPIQPINIVLNAIVNHTLDASLLANSLTPLVREKTGALEALVNHKWYPGLPLVVRSMDDVKQLTFGTPNLTALLNLFVLIERFGEDVTGLTNYLIGKESPDDPDAPASKTLALMRKAEIRLRRYVKNIKDSINEVGYQAIMRIYQFKSQDEIAEILGIAPEEVDMSMPLRFIKPQAQASGFAIEKMFEFRDAIQFFSMLMKDPEVLTNPLRRVTLYNKIAHIKGSNWEKMLIGVLPSPEEIKRKQFLTQHVQKKMMVVKNAAKQGLERGMQPQQVEELGKLAGSKYDEMSGVAKEELDEFGQEQQRISMMKGENQK